MDVQFQVAGTLLARKCEISHWLYCGAEEQVEGWTDGRTFAQNFLDGYNQIFFAMGFLRVELRCN